MINKSDGQLFSIHEKESLLKELNILYPDIIKWEDDGGYKSVVVCKTKNYVLQTYENKIIIKGSGLLASNKERALRSFLREACTLLLDEKKDEVIELYKSYAKRIMTIKDMTDWVSKKTITKAVLNPERTNEQKVLDAIDESGEILQEGDKIYVYFKISKELGLLDQWNYDHDPYVLLSKLYKTALIFNNIIPKTNFINYALKGKRTNLNDL
jgi:hypothetical protein